MTIDEVGYIPFEAEAANLFFQLVSFRYEQASLIVTSDKPFCRWGEVFGDDVATAAMIDRLVHHAEVVSLKGRQLAALDRRQRLQVQPPLTSPGCCVTPDRPTLPGKNSLALGQRNSTFGRVGGEASTQRCTGAARLLVGDNPVPGRGDTA